MTTAIPMQAVAYNVVPTSKTGGVGSECTCGPGGYGHFSSANRTYSSGVTKGSAYMEVRYSGHKGSMHVEVGNVIGSTKTIVGPVSGGTNYTSCTGPVSVTEIHSYSPY